MDSEYVKREVDRLYAQHEANSNDYNFDLLSIDEFLHANTGHLSNRMPEGWMLSLDFEDLPKEASKCRKVPFIISVQTQTPDGKSVWNPVFEGQATNENNFMVKLTLNEDGIYSGRVPSIKELTNENQAKLTRLLNLCGDILGEQLDQEYEKAVKKELEIDVRGERDFSTRMDLINEELTQSMSTITL